MILAGKVDNTGEEEQESFEDGYLGVCEL